MKDIAILDFGSGKIAFAVGVNSVDSSFVIKNFACIEYAGYFNGEWVFKDSLKSDVENVIRKSGFDFKQRTLFVVVPSQFTQIKTNGIYSDLGRKRTVNSSVLMGIHSKAEGIKPSGYSTLCSSAVEYVLDSSRHTLNPIGETASSIYADMSYVFCKDSFIGDVYAIAGQLGFKEVKFIDGIWAEGSQLIDESGRVGGAVLIDVGYASTTFALVKGDGLIYKKDKQFGIGYMIDGLAKALGVDYEIAQEMIPQVTLNIESDETSVYQYQIGMRKYQCKTKDINSFLQGMISSELVGFIEDCIEEINRDGAVEADSENQSPINFMTEFYVTGGGLCSIRGGTQFLSKSLSQEFEILAGNTAGWDKPYYASLFSSLEIAAKMKKKSTLLEKLFG